LNSVITGDVINDKPIALPKKDEKKEKEEAKPEGDAKESEHHAAESWPDAEKEGKEAPKAEGADSAENADSGNSTNSTDGLPECEDEGGNSTGNGTDGGNGTGNGAKNCTPKDDGSHGAVGSN